MATLASTLHGVNVTNPLGLGSGPPTTNGNVIKGAVKKGGWGIAVLKTMSLDGTEIVNVPQRYARPGASSDGPFPWHLNRELTSDRHSFAAWIDDIKMLRDDCPDLVIVASVIEQFDEKRWAEIIGRCDEAGAHWFELNLSCPHGFESRKMGGAVGDDPQLIGDVCAWACRSTKKPVYAKLYPNASPAAYNEQARVAFEAGCAGVTCTNTFRGAPPIDLDSKDFDPVGAIEGHAMTGGISGLGILPQSLAKVFDVASFKSKNGFADRLISGVGGIYDLQGFVSHLCYGASWTQVCTAFMTKGYGPEMGRALLDDLLELLENRGMNSPADLVGLATPKITDHPHLLALTGGKATTLDETFRAETFTDQMTKISAG